jgi:hypothetical protein
MSPVNVSVPEVTPDSAITIALAIELGGNSMAGICVSGSLSVSTELSLAKRKPGARKLVREDLRDMASNKYQDMASDRHRDMS